MRPVPRRFSLHPSFDLFRTLTFAQKFKNEPEHPWVVVPMMFITFSFLCTPLCRMSSVVVATTCKLTTDRGLVTAENTGDITLVQPRTVESFQLLPLEAGKMGHTVGGKGLSAFPPTVLKIPMHLRFQFRITAH